MALLVLFILALIATAILLYPLLPGRIPAQAPPAVTDKEIEQAVRALRRSRRERASGPSCPACPACGQVYQAGDRFCVRCGELLPPATPATPTCPACGARVGPDDRFCARCGRTLPDRGVT